MRISLRLILALIVAIWLAETAVAHFRVMAGRGFDGRPINLNGSVNGSGNDSVNGSGLREAAPGLEAEVVAVIMRHAGLPQNFSLYANPEVANAAAVILVDKDGHGKRALICNEQFVKTAQQASAEGNWAPISIIAHEIGHHIAGQPLVDGDWQSHGELAADAFSGFILYKLGAKLGEASRAVNTLAMKKDRDLSRDERLLAVRHGWMLACRQQSAHCEGGETVLLLPAPTTIRQPGKESVPSGKADGPAAPAVPSPVAGGSVGGSVGGSASGATSGSTNGPAEILPLPDRREIPVKFGKFVIDELGVLDRAARAGFERKMFELAATNQVEIVTIISKDLHGLTADEYAQAMLRQLAVGGEDVANGAVLLVAPHEKQVGMALAPGLAAALGDKAAMAREQLKNFEEFSLLTCQGSCRAEQTAMLFHAATFIADMTRGWDFSVTYPPGGALPAGDVGAGVICLRGKIIGRDATPQVIPPAAPAKTLETTLKMVDEAGQEALLSLFPEVEKPAWTSLTIGKSYQFIVRELPPSGQTRRFQVLSYAALP